MDGTPLSDSSNSSKFVSFPVGPSFYSDFSNLGVEQAQTGGAGTAAFDDNGLNPFVSHPSISEAQFPISTVVSHSIPPYTAPLSPTTDPNTPQTPISDGDSDSSDNGPKEYRPQRCNSPNCKNKKVFKLRCELR
jgi:hypothetical protein